MTLLKAHHAQIMVPAPRETEAREFYIDFLGINEVPKPAALAARGGFWLELDGFQIHIGVGDETKSPESREHLAFVVGNIGHWRKRLDTRSIAVIDGTPIPGYRRIEFRDPFNNRIEFLEMVG